MSRIDGVERKSASIKRIQYLTGAVAALVVLLGVYALLQRHRLNHPSREHAMTKVISQMKTMCFGRYLIDVPSDAEIALGSAELDSNQIKRIPAFANRAAYVEQLQQREASLRSARHETEGSLLKSVVKSADGQQTVFVSRPEADDRRTYLIEAFVYSPVAAWQVFHRTGDKYLKETTEQISEIAQSLSYRPASVIPTIPGACLEDGLLNRTPEHSEEYQGGARSEAYSWSLSITSETSGPRDNVEFSDLFTRVDKANEMAGAGAAINKLRRAEVQADGRTGQEYVALYSENNASVFDAKLELYGNAKPQLPTIKLQMESGSPIERDPRDTRKFLTQEEALALWDAMIKSIRPRPGAF